MSKDQSPTWIAKLALVSTDLINGDVAKLLLKKRRIRVTDVEDLVIDEHCKCQTIGFLLDHGNITPELSRIYKQKLRDLQVLGGTAILISAGKEFAASDDELPVKASHHREVNKPFDGDVAEQILKIVDMRN